MAYCISTGLPQGGMSVVTNKLYCTKQTNLQELSILQAKVHKLNIYHQLVLPSA